MNELKFRNFLMAMTFPTIILMLAAVHAFISLILKDRWLANVVWYGGGATAIVAVLAYVVLWDSPKRWPSLNAGQRLRRVLTFKR